MKKIFVLSLFSFLMLICIPWNTVYSQDYKKEYTYRPFLWKSEVPEDCPFEASEKITGPWSLVSYMEKFGEQAYFVHTPSKFISDHGRTACLFYSANFQSPNYKENHRSYPPGSGYGLSVQEIEFILDKKN